MHSDMVHTAYVARVRCWRKGIPSKIKEGIKSTMEENMFWFIRIPFLWAPWEVLNYFAKHHTLPTQMQDDACVTLSTNIK